jgi:hypothetical protein
MNAGKTVGDLMVKLSSLKALHSSRHQINHNGSVSFG